MRLLGICGSARPHGVSETVLQECLKAARTAGWRTDAVFVAVPELAGCRGCLVCDQNGRCVMAGDAVSELLDTVIPAQQALLVVTPVYFMGIPWCLKRVVDRAQVYYARRMRAGGDYPERGFSGAVIVSGTAPRRRLAGPRLVLRAFLKEVGFPCQFEGWLDTYETGRQPLDRRLARLARGFGDFLAHRG